MKKTKDGFVRENVVIAKTGAMQYLGSEIGMGLNPSQTYDVHVESDQLFSKDTIDSIEGADVTFIHPDSLEITLNDWKQLAVGHVQNVYRDGDFLKGTIFIKDKNAIASVENDGIVEVSLGYDSDIVQKNGKLTKTNIRANHLAIVPEGRCGSACKIGDSKKGIKTMVKTRKKLPIADSIALMLGGKTSAQKTASRKFGDTRKKLNDAKLKLADSARQKLADLDEVVQNPDATPEQLKTAAEAVSSVSDDISQVIDILDGANDSVDEAAEAVDNIPVNDAQLPEGVTIPDELAGYVSELETEAADAKTQLEEANAKIADLQAELDKLKGEGDTATAVADAKMRFPKIKIGDAKSARDVQAQILVAKGIYTDSQAKTLSDCAIGSAYQALTVKEHKEPSSFGKKLVDFKGNQVNRASQLGGKK